MKIVQFRDGTYAVRQWSWLQLAYEYLDRDAKGMYGTPLFGAYYCAYSRVDTLAEAKQLLTEYNENS